MADREPACKLCGGTGRIRQLQGFFTLERICPTCKSDELAEAFRRETNESRQGYVYILGVAAGIFKIGHTQRQPQDRAHEWKLKLIAYAWSEDSAGAEKRIHSHLARHRKGSYELFEISIDDAIRALEEIGGTATVLQRR